MAKAAKSKPVAKTASAPKGKVLKTLGSAVSKLVGRGKSHAQPSKKGAATKKAQETPAKAEKAAKTASKETSVPAKQAGKAASVGKGKDFKKSVGQARTALEKVSGPHRAISVSSAICREVACELMSTTGGYCRMHYIKNWKKIKRKELILKEKKLNHYIEELVSKYPDKYIEAIRVDLASEKDFAKVIADLEIDEALEDFEIETPENTDEGLLDNLKRFDDDGDVF